MKQKLFFESAGDSDVGKQRQYNEDALIASDELGLYAIADGMGGHMHGDVASQVTIETMLSEVSTHIGFNSKSLKQEIYYETIASAIETCNKLILMRNAENDCEIGEGMGTTLVGAYFIKESMQAVVFNVGDSRIYRLRNGDLEQITRDHTMYQEWINAGKRGPAPSKSILVNAVGAVEELSPDIQLEKVFTNDLYIFCSDGLSGLVDDNTLKEYMSKNSMLPVENICKQLIDLANENGGNDNVTVIIVRVKIHSSDSSVLDSNSQPTIQRSHNV